MNEENEENESEINEIEYLFASKEISEEDNFLDNEDYNIFNENNSEEEEEKEEEEEDDDDIMQMDEEKLNKEVIEGLRLLHLKSLYNFTEAAYNDIIKLFTNKNISLYKVKKILEEFTGLVPTFYDICENSCICYTDVYESYQNCPLCNSSRYDSNNKPKKVMPYLSIKEMLKIQYNNKVRAKELLYRYEYITNKELDDDDLYDIFDGEIYKELLERNLFKNNRDIAFTVSCDGYQIFKQKTDDCWAFLIINNNLDPLIRVKKENLLIPFLIPGPNQPKDFNTFLRPFINEMKELEGKYFILFILY
jgi:hypothetical protein